MRRVLSIAVLVAVAAAVAVLGAGAGGSSATSSGYEVRAIFDNAVSAIPGEDVRVAGVKVGSITGLDVTPDQKAAVVLNITDPGFRNFRADASCTIRPQSLIGDRFVECTPTQPRAEGAPTPPDLGTTPPSQNPGHSADVSQQHYLPVTQTSTPVDLDLIQNILRLPYRQRLTLLVSELGTGLAARGPDLREVIHRANPALQQADRVLGLLSTQNRTLAQLATDSDTVLAPLARERARVADFVVQANTTAAATAQRTVALEAGLQRLPAFLTQLKPTLVKLSALSDQATPTLNDLSAAAPDINRVIAQLGPFSRAGIPAFRALGAAAHRGIPAVQRARPIVADLRRTAAALAPLLATTAPLLTSFRDTGGIERVMDYLFYQTAAINGYDSFSHYLRAGVIVNTCSTYSITPVSGCSANFGAGPRASTAAARSLGRRDPGLLRAAAVLRGATPASVLGRPGPPPAAAPAPRQAHRLGVASTAAPAGPTAAAPAGARPASAPLPAPAPTSPAPTSPAPTSPAPASPAVGSTGGSGSSPADPATSLLQFLMGH